MKRTLYFFFIRCFQITVGYPIKRPWLGPLPCSWRFCRHQTWWNNETGLGWSRENWSWSSSRKSQNPTKENSKRFKQFKGMAFAGRVITPNKQKKAVTSRQRGSKGRLGTGHNAAYLCQLPPRLPRLTGQDCTRTWAQGHKHALQALPPVGD